jgi:hypothetical protein
MGQACRQPGRSCRRQQADLIVQLYGHAAGLGEQQLMAPVLMTAGVVPAEGGGNPDGAAVVLIRVKRVIGKNKGHVSDY